MMCAYLLADSHTLARGRLYLTGERVFEAVLMLYSRTLRRALHWPGLVTLSLLTMLGSSIYLSIIIPKGFVPQQDNGLIMGGLFAGQTRETAARFSFLLSIPAVGASGLLELKEAVHKLPHGTSASLLVATVVSGIVGYLSIWFLLRYLRTHSTALFIIYRLIVGGAILTALFTGALSAAGH